MYRGSNLSEIQVARVWLVALGVKVEQMVYEPCMYKITREGVGFVCAHVDDNDGTFEKAADAKWWIEATNELFKSEKSPGVKVVSADYALPQDRISYGYEIGGCGDNGFRLNGSNANSIERFEDC